MTTDPSDDAGPLHLNSDEETLIAEFWAPLAKCYAGAYDLKDDAASIAVPPGEELIVSTDALIAGVHFFADEDPGSIGWKALAVNVSDLVAKGATPLAYLMHIAFPERPQSQWLQAFVDGLSAAQAAFGCHLAGGDTDRTPGPLSISITAFGTVPAGQMIRRSGAGVGDRVYVTGTIGDAHLGLALKRDAAMLARWDNPAGTAQHLIARLVKPQPPLNVIPALRGFASASMDISDGLMKDFERLCRTSGVGGRLQAEAVPLSPPARALLAAGETTLLDLLSGGEDYEVLACVPEAHAAEFEAAANKHRVCVTHIGHITPADTGVSAVDATNRPLRFLHKGWDHFA
ncbi:thiamine-phosphate kinase [Hyphomicrobium sulfonivorans]|uniref:thiamine-phosphate kinase n=1 Tax=Hyphomicrobium sulfonivorans TaxID=121290 RepID=UPI00156E4A11|nr:thiamine-phosphate kinase [Hyphomicrobium sulfonivorans]MBI1651396.1 thiamine-phosphate kinase [Hyphomicrobium sulfonivorans]NSL73217.1 thiamine-phosphate kinase [Hyphomicrobium sulfonivorans]